MAGPLAITCVVWLLAGAVAASDGAVTPAAAAGCASTDIEWPMAFAQDAVGNDMEPATTTQLDLRPYKLVVRRDGGENALVWLLCDSNQMQCTLHPGPEDGVATEVPLLPPPEWGAGETSDLDQRGLMVDLHGRMVPIGASELRSYLDLVAPPAADAADLSKRLAAAEFWLLLALLGALGGALRWCLGWEAGALRVGRLHVYEEKLLGSGSHGTLVFEGRIGKRRATPSTPLLPRAAPRGSSLIPRGVRRRRVAVKRVLAAQQLLAKRETRAPPPPMDHHEPPMDHHEEDHGAATAVLPSRVRSRGRREIRALRQCDDHPHVLRFFMHHARGPYVYLALELAAMSLERCRPSPCALPRTPPHRRARPAMRLGCCGSHLRRAPPASAPRRRERALIITRQVGAPDVRGRRGGARGTAAPRDQRAAAAAADVPRRGAAARPRAEPRRHQAEQRAALGRGRRQGARPLCRPHM